MTLFDLPVQKTTTDMSQWAPILEWLRPVIDPAPLIQATGPTPILQSQRVKSSLSDCLLPAQESMVHGDRLFSVKEHRYTPTRIHTLGTQADIHQISISERQQTPSFLKQIV